MAFQSTPSVGRATKDIAESRHRINISIHALRGEGDAAKFVFVYADNDISIHALRGEGDSARRITTAKSCHFNPHPPWGGRPCR